MSTTTSNPFAMTGDGTTTASRARARWHRWWFPLVIVLLVIVAGLLAWLPQPVTNGVALSPENPGRNGARALAQILGRQGVHITTVTSTSTALAAARAGSTLLVVGDQFLDDTQVADLAASPADLVLVDLDWSVGTFLPGVTSGVGDSSVSARKADCADPDAVAAGTITGYGTLDLAADAHVTSCFTTPSYDSSVRSASFVRTGTGRTVTAMADSHLMTNAALADEGNAALALRVLGRHRDLVWLLPDAKLPSESSSDSVQILPSWLQTVALQLLVAAFFAAFWRGRRLGPVVAERMPVVVPTAETTRGRGRLYRRFRAHGRAAAALRAGAALRLGTRLGLPRSAGAPALITAVALASGRREDEVATLLYGPPPADDLALTRLAHQLDTLEREVHRT